MNVRSLVLSSYVKPQWHVTVMESSLKRMSLLGKLVTGEQFFTGEVSNIEVITTILYHINNTIKYNILLRNIV